MRINYIPALLVTLALAAPFCAAQHGHAGGASHPGGTAPHSAPMRQPHSRQPAFAAQHAVAPARPQSQPAHPPAMPHQIIRGQGPHNGDWLRNTMRLPPQEQQKRLEQDQHFRQLPQQRQEQLRNRLQTFNSMPQQQQQRVLNRMEMFEHLRPEQQKQAMNLFGQFRAMDPPRKETMRRTLREMRTMPPDARERMLNSPETQSHYSPQEIQMLRGFDDIGFVGP
jgi:plasmid maintenance system killer protein